MEAPLTRFELLNEVHGHCRQKSLEKLGAQSAFTMPENLEYNKLK
jgi:hypothetical protein